MQWRRDKGQKEFHTFAGNEKFIPDKAKILKIPSWKRWLSYLFEFHIESVSSELNPHLYVSLSRGRFQLSTAHAIYSFGDLYDNFSIAFSRLDFERFRPKDVLILGFGLGSVPIILEKMLPQRKFHFTGVEADEAVLYLAYKYALPDIASPIELIHADAFAFVSQQRKKFDLIAMDIFVDDEIPAIFEKEDFIKRLKLLLSPGGLLIYNRLARTKDDQKKTDSFFTNAFKSVFPTATYLGAGGNRMLLNRADFLKMNPHSVVR